MISETLRYMPTRGYARRMSVYLREMYPVFSRIISALCLYLSFTLFLAKITNVTPDLISTYSLLGIWAIFAIALILRLMDELKDRQTDMILFKDRPLPMGKVREEDIKFSLISICFIYKCSHLLSEQILLSSLIVLAYAFLMFRYFFLPKRCHDRLLLNLATHNPITALILINITVIFAVQSNVKLIDLDWSLLLPLTLKFWFLFLAWEIARKIRYPEEETDYLTYSRIFGHHRAAVISLLIQTVSLGIALYLYNAISLSPVYLIFVGIGYSILLCGYVRFFIKKMSAGIKLRNHAEIYAIIMMTAMIVDSGIKVVQ